MPPKKGKGKKKGGKGKGDKKAPAPPAEAKEPPLNELSKQFYLIQIKDLEERLARYQAKCDRLQLSNERLERELGQTTEDHEQMVLYLKKKGLEQTNQFLELEEKMTAVQLVKDTEHDRYEQQITQLKSDSQLATDRASVEIKVLLGQLEALEHFRLNKESLEAELRSQEELVERLKEEHGEALYTRDKKTVLDKDRMKKEMVAKVNSVASEFRKVSDLQMAETTKRTIRENVAINQQLSKMSDKTMELLRDNEALRVSEMSLQRHVEVLEFNSRELTRRNVSNQKLLALLRDKAAAREAKLSSALREADGAGRLQEEARAVLEDTRAAKQEAELCRVEVSRLEAEVSALRQRLEAGSRELHKLRSVMERSSQTIQASLQPVAPDSEQSLQRENLLATLLEILNLTSAPSHSPHQHASTSQARPTVPYRPGDLGIVPAPHTPSRPHPASYSHKHPSPSTPLTSTGTALTSGQVR